MENREQFNDQTNNRSEDHQERNEEHIGLQDRQALHNRLVSQDDEEVAQEVSPNPVMMKDRRDRNEEDIQNGKSEAGGFGIGLTALILSILAFFVWPFVLSIAGIVVGIFAVRRRSALGWWAVAVGIVALIMAFLLFPFRILF